MFVFLAVFLLLWEIIIRIFEISDYLFIGPVAIVKGAVENYQLLLKNAAVTVLEIILGLSLGVSSGIILSVMISYFKFCKIVIYPLIVALQSVPKIVFVPVILVWLGFGLPSKIVIAAIFSLFPVLINLIKGMENLDRKLIDLLIAYRCSKREIFFKARLPNALPDFFAGVKIATPLSVIGAIVGEFMGTSEGLGYLISLGQSLLNLPLTFNVAIILGCVGIFLFKIVNFLERKTMPWNHLKESEIELMF